MSNLAHPPTRAEPACLLDVLDRLLDTGVVADGQIVLTVAGVDLVFLGVRALLASVDTAARITNPANRLSAT